MMKTILNGPENLKICTPLQKKKKKKKTEKIEKIKQESKKKREIKPPNLPISENEY